MQTEIYYDEGDARESLIVKAYPSRVNLIIKNGVRITEVIELSPEDVERLILQLTKIMESMTVEVRENENDPQRGR